MGASKREKRRKYGRETLEMQPRLIMSHQQRVAMTTDFINRPMRGQRQDEFTIESFLFTLCLSLSTIFVVLGAHSSQLNSGTLGTIYEIYKLNELSDTRKLLSVHWLATMQLHLGHELTVSSPNSSYVARNHFELWFKVEMSCNRRISCFFPIWVPTRLLLWSLTTRTNPLLWQVFNASQLCGFRSKCGPLFLFHLKNFNLKSRGWNASAIGSVMEPNTNKCP